MGLQPEPLTINNDCFSPGNPSGHQQLKAWIKKYSFGSDPEAAVDIAKHRSAANKSHSIYKAFPRRQLNQAQKDCFLDKQKQLKRYEFNFKYNN